MNLKNLSKKGRIGLAVGVAGAASMVGLLAIPSTFGGFTDTTSNPGNGIAAGTLQVTNTHDGTFVVSTPNQKPGDVSSASVTITNSGTLASTETLAVSSIAHALCVACSPKGQGDLSGYATVKITDDTKPATLVPAGTLVSALPASTSVPGLSAASWASGEAHIFTVEITFPNAGNATDDAYQGTSTSFALAFNGVQ